MDANVIMFILQALIVAAMIAVVVSIAVPLIRWALRINEIVSLQKEILANLQRINANTQPPSGS